MFVAPGSDVSSKSKPGRGVLSAIADRLWFIFKQMSFVVVHHLGVMAVVALPLAGCAGLAQRGDAMCPEIARFANASADLEPHSVVLRTSWGRGFNNDPEHLYEIECSHSDYGPGRKLCRYLMENTSIEFPSYNFRRALACLSKSGHDIGAGVDIVRLDGEFSSYSARGVNDDVKVGIEFTDGTGDETPVLRITAKRWKVD